VRLTNTGQSTVLLIDRNPLKRQLRSTVFRNCDLNVWTANGVEEAQRLCRVHPFDMVLLSADHDSREASVFCAELRGVAPNQRIALLVGPPSYLREITMRKKQPSSQPGRPDRKLFLVETQSQPTQWSTLVRRLLAVG
jgi:response regulator RpfG family c-di-GMP phosphodiesterase